MRAFHLATGAAALLTVLTASGAMAEGAPCYDAAVHGRAVRQVAADIPPCNDCVVMQSPYLVELKITRVWEGDVRKGRLTVVRMQHGVYNAPYQTWYLRRNSAGGFNALRFDPAKPPPRCAADAGPDTPILTPPEGQTLDDLLRDAIKKRRAR